MSGRLVMGYWDCPYCGTRKIKGTYDECQYCGAPRNKDTEFYMEGEVVYLTEEEAELKGKGADWHCAYCDSLQSVLEDTCQNCGATREESSKNYFQLQEEKKRKLEEERRIARSYEQSYSVNDSYDSDSYKNNESYDDYSNTDYSSGYERKTTYSDVDEYRQQKKERRQIIEERNNSFLYKFKSFIFENGGMIAAFIGGFLLLAGLIYLLIPKPQTIEITEVSWENNIRIESYETVRESDWSIPAGGRLAYSQEEFHHYDKVFSHYETKTRTYTERVIDHYETEYSYTNNGDGTFTEHSHQVPVYTTVTKTEEYQEAVYDDVPVYKTKYYYDIDKWVYKRTVTTSGTDKSPYWGDVNLKQNEREGSRGTSYYLTGFDVDDKDKEIKTFGAPANIWQQCNVGDVVTFEISFNTIVEIVP